MELESYKEEVVSMYEDEDAADTQIDNCSAQIQCDHDALMSVIETVKLVGEHRVKLGNLCRSLSEQEASEEVIHYVQEYIDILEGYYGRAMAFAKILEDSIEETERKRTHYQTIGEAFRDMYDEIESREDLW